MSYLTTISGFKSKRVLIVGDIMLDKYVFGSVNRVSPEAPVPVLSYQNETCRLGGAANVALNVVSLGAEAYLCGVVGMDKEASQLFGLLQDHTITQGSIVQVKTRPTTSKTRFIAGNQHLLRLDQEDANDIEIQTSENLILRIKSVIATKRPDVIVLQDYNKGVLTKFLITEIIELSRMEGIPVAVDPKSANFWEYKNVALFKPNFKELKEALPFEINKNDAASLEKGTTYLMENLHNSRTLVTLSENGVFAKEGETVISQPTIKRNVADVCGAGDGVIAILSLALTQNTLSIKELAQLANLAGGQIVEKVGVVPIDLEQLKTELQKQILNM